MISVDGDVCSDLYRSELSETINDGECLAFNGGPLLPLFRKLM